MIRVVRAEERFRSSFDGVRSWHSFSAGAQYDPDNVVFGPVVACDEHALAPGAGFERHRHARVELVSWVLDGTLCHEDASGRVVVVAPGEVQHQVAGQGIEHIERNASRTEPLRFVQLWLLSDVDRPAYSVEPPPVQLTSATFSVVRRAVVTAPTAHVFATGPCVVSGHVLRAGDTLRASGETLAVEGDADLLVITVDS